MGMNLSAIQPRKAAVKEQAEHDTAQRNRGATHGNLLFRDTAPVLEAIAKGLKAEPVQATAPAQGGLATALKAMTGAMEKAATAIRASTPKQAAAALAPVAPAPVRSTGNPPSVPMVTETQRRREAEAREEARKAAAQADAERVLVVKSGPRVLTFRKLDGTLSDAAVLALNHIVQEWEKAERRPVRIYAADLSRALDIPLAAAQAAYTELVDKHLVISSKDSMGVLRVQPGLGVTGV